MNQDSVNTNVEEERKMMETWPKTEAPKIYTQTPIPIQNTNPPIVIPDVGKPLPPPTKSSTMPPDQKDTKAEAGAADDMDYRPDLSEYQLLVVKDKDIPDITGYNPRAKLKFFPKGNLPGSNETFYLVTHRFADRAGVMAENRGQLTIKSDSTGRPQHPLRAETGAAGGGGNYRTQEKAEGTDKAAANPISTANIIILIIVGLMLAVLLAHRNKEEGIQFRRH